MLPGNFSFPYNFIARMPPEMVLAVAKLLPDKDVYALSLVDKRLHHMAVPLLLTRHGLTGLGRRVIAMSGAALTVVGVWCRWLGFKAPSYMIVILSGVPDRAKRECTALQDFFARVDPGSVETVYLSLEADADEVDYTSVLMSIIKAGVRQLRVKQDRPSCVINRYRSSKRHASYDFIFPRLKVFEPEAPFLFTSRFFSWTLGVLNGSAIRELTLQCKQSATPHWSDLMTYISMPTLRAFTVEGHVSIPALTEFLYHHPALESLVIGAHSISSCTTFAPAKLPSRSQSLCRLTMLQAPLSYLVHLIGVSRWGTSSSLTELRILPDDACPRYPFTQCLEHILRQIADMECLCWLSIEIPQAIGEGPDIWCNLCPPGTLESYMSLSHLTITQSGSSPNDRFVFSDTCMVGFGDLSRYCF